MEEIRKSSQESWSFTQENIMNNKNTSTSFLQKADKHICREKLNCFFTHEKRKNKTDELTKLFNF